MLKTIIITATIAALWTNASALPSRQSNSPGSNPEYWWLCPVDRSLPSRPEYSDPDADPESAEIRAGQSRVLEKDISDFDDSVEFIKGKLAVRADHVAYDQPANIGRIFGDVHLWNSDLLWRGQRATVLLDSDTYRLDKGAYWLLGSPGRGVAQRITSNNTTHNAKLEQAEYTTCPVSNEAWKFSATRIRLQHEEDRGYATNALLRVHNIPVLYFPYASFPLSGKRKSGLLIPTFGTSSTQGFDTRIPYYVNIAPNQDATVTPRWISRRGLMMNGEYRYLGEDFKSNLNFSYLPSDTLAGDADRSSVRFLHDQRFDSRRGRVYALLQNVSDAQYFEDFGGSLSLSSQRYLDRRIETTYSGRNYYVKGLVQAFQSVDDSIPDIRLPYRRLPQLMAQTRFPMRHLQPHFQMLTDLTYFSRADSVSGGRLDLEPTVSLPFIQPWLFVKPSVGLRTANYFLSDAGSLPSDPSRVVPLFSTDAQFFAERLFTFADTSLMQTFEPRVFYLYVPRVKQDDIPIFDSGLFDFSFANLFRENRFSGRDRFGDANQITLAASTRFLSMGDGREVLAASVGQIRYFESRTITLPRRPVDDGGESAYVTEISSSPVEDWSTRATMQWDPDTNRIDKSALALRYAPRDGTLINAAYRLRGTTRSRRLVNDIYNRAQDVEQTDISFRVPLTENLNMIGRWNYSLRGEESLELVGGIELETCCWGIRVFSRRYIRNVEGKFDNAVFMQVEFKGLAGLGSTATSFLKRNIPGYEPMF